MHTQLQKLCAMTRARGIRTTILTTGLLLERDAEWIAESVDDLIVSLDGPPSVHDRIRGIPGAFPVLERGICSVRRRNAALPISARCTVQRVNHDVLPETADAAHDMGLNGISFLAVDSASSAFDHTPERTVQLGPLLALGSAQIDVLARGIENLIAAWGGRGFIVEGPLKLRRIVTHFRAQLRLCEASAPACNAPWVSTVIETDGTVRPCFFHPPIGRIGDGGVAAVLNSPKAVTFRSELDMSADPICRRCVCSLKR